VKIVKYPSVATLSALRNGRHDPTTVIGQDHFFRATHTPEGLGSIHVRRINAEVDIEVSGPGGDWLLRQSGFLLGNHDQPPHIESNHEAIRNAQRRHRDTRLARSGTAYHELIPAVLGQTHEHLPNCPITSFTDSASNDVAGKHFASWLATSSTSRRYTTSQVTLVMPPANSLHCLASELGLLPLPGSSPLVMPTQLQSAISI
jgi:hypothetical protein